jgi:CRISPR-associated protein Cas1
MMSLPDFKNKQIILVFTSDGDKLSFRNDNIVVTDGGGKIKHQSTCYRLFALFIVGHTSVTSGLLQRAKKFGFNLVFFTPGLKPYGSWQYKTEGNVILRQKQYSYNDTAIARHIVKNKIDSQTAYLQKKRDKNVALRNAIEKLYGYADHMNDKSLGFQDILGIEGVASRLYFANMFDNIEWRGRLPRVKKDIVNLMLDIGYTLLFNFMDALLNLYGFDVFKGVYHKEFYHRKSLVSDTMEPFRPIVDYQIRKAYNLGQINPNDFDYIGEQYRLFGKNAKPYITFLLESILEHKDVIFLYVQRYYRAFMRDKSIDSYPVFSVEGLL